MTSAELADRLGLPFAGVPVELHGAAALDSATGANLSFVVAPKSFPSARASLAGCILAPETYEPAGEQSVIWAAEPRASFSLALALLYPPRPLLPGVHASASVAHNVAIAATAEIGPNCTLDTGTVVGPDTRIGPGCHIGAGVHIGSNCVLHAGVQLYPGTRVGDRVILHSGCVLGADGFGFTRQPEGWVKFPQVGHVEIGDDVEIGANSCVDRGALGPTVIGAGSKLDNLVHIGHNCQIGRHVVIAAQTGLSGGVVVGDNAVIGGQVGIGDKARIEPGAIVGSGSGVLTSKIVRVGAGPVWGTPARPLRQYLAQLAALTRVSGLRHELQGIRKAIEELKSLRPGGGAP